MRVVDVFAHATNSLPVPRQTACVKKLALASRFFIFSVLFLFNFSPPSSHCNCSTWFRSHCAVFHSWIHLCFSNSLNPSCRCCCRCIRPEGWNKTYHCAECPSYFVGCALCVYVCDVGWRAVNHCFARLSTAVRCGALSCGMILWTFCVPHSCDVFVLHFLLQVHPFCSRSMTCDYFGIYIYETKFIYIFFDEQLTKWPWFSSIYFFASVVIFSLANILAFQLIQPCQLCCCAAKKRYI